MSDAKLRDERDMKLMNNILSNFVRKGGVPVPTTLKKVTLDQEEGYGGCWGGFRGPEAAHIV